MHWVFLFLIIIFCIIVCLLILFIFFAVFFAEIKKKNFFFRGLLTYDSFFIRKFLKNLNKESSHFSFVITNTDFNSYVSSVSVSENNSFVLMAIKNSVLIRIKHKYNTIEYKNSLYNLVETLKYNSGGPIINRVLVIYPVDFFLTCSIDHLMHLNNEIENISQITKAKLPVYICLNKMESVEELGFLQCLNNNQEFSFLYDVEQNFPKNNYNQIYEKIFSLQLNNMDLTEDLNYLHNFFFSQQNLIEKKIRNITSPHYFLRMLFFVCESSEPESTYFGLSFFDNTIVNRFFAEKYILKITKLQHSFVVGVFSFILNSLIFFFTTYIFFNSYFLLRSFFSLFRLIDLDVKNLQEDYSYIQENLLNIDPKHLYLYKVFFSKNHKLVISFLSNIFRGSVLGEKKKKLELIVKNSLKNFEYYEQNTSYKLVSGQSLNFVLNEIKPIEEFFILCREEKIFSPVPSINVESNNEIDDELRKILEPIENKVLLILNNWYKSYVPFIVIKLGKSINEQLYILENHDFHSQDVTTLCETVDILINLLSDEKSFVWLNDKGFVPPQKYFIEINEKLKTFNFFSTVFFEKCNEIGEEHKTNFKIKTTQFKNRILNIFDNSREETYWSPTEDLTKLNTILSMIGSKFTTDMDYELQLPNFNSFFKIREVGLQKLCDEIESSKKDFPKINKNPRLNLIVNKVMRFCITNGFKKNIQYDVMNDSYSTMKNLTLYYKKNLSKLNLILEYLQEDQISKEISELMTKFLQSQQKKLLKKIVEFLENNFLYTNVQKIKMWNGVDDMGMYMFSVNGEEELQQIFEEEFEKLKDFVVLFLEPYIKELSLFSDILDQDDRLICSKLSSVIDDVNKKIGKKHNNITNLEKFFSTLLKWDLTCFLQLEKTSAPTKTFFGDVLSKWKQNIKEKTKPIFLKQTVSQLESLFSEFQGLLQFFPFNSKSKNEIDPQVFLGFLSNLYECSSWILESMQYFNFETSKYQNFIAESFNFLEYFNEEEKSLQITSTIEYIPNHEYSSNLMYVLGGTIQVGKKQIELKEKKIDFTWAPGDEIIFNIKFPREQVILPIETEQPIFTKQFNGNWAIFGLQLECNKDNLFMIDIDIIVNNKEIPVKLVFKTTKLPKVSINMIY